MLLLHVLCSTTGLCILLNDSTLLLGVFISKKLPLGYSRGFAHHLLGRRSGEKDGGLGELAHIQSAWGCTDCNVRRYVLFEVVDARRERASIVDWTSVRISQRYFYWRQWVVSIGLMVNWGRMLHCLLKGLERWGIIQLNAQLPWHKSLRFLVWAGRAQRISRAYRRVVHELIADTKFILSRLTNNTCLMAMVILHHILCILSWSNKSLNWYIFAFC